MPDEQGRFRGIAVPRVPWKKADPVPPADEPSDEASAEPPQASDADER